ncbi:hypothetical protein NQ317_017556 [Molorchus minor]|uniref:Uncharacterized protein n=1 Tax=Molorchus minor TaxID=1323400 RepID=A0ABQ9J060_9CUCU|nr:hypothetical protein NQ317_017556 [Molorchus minor]
MIRIYSSTRILFNHNIKCFEAIVALSASVVVVGVLARYLRRKKRIVDPVHFRKSTYSSKRSRASGIRSPNGDRFRCSSILLNCVVVSITLKS